MVEFGGDERHICAINITSEKSIFITRPPIGFNLILRVFAGWNLYTRAEQPVLHFDLFTPIWNMETLLSTYHAPILLLLRKNTIKWVNKWMYTTPTGRSGHGNVRTCKQSSKLCIIWSGTISSKNYISASRILLLHTSHIPKYALDM